MADTTFVNGVTVVEAAWLNDVNNFVYNPSGSVTAVDIGYTPTGNIVATNVQAAINELDTEKQPASANLDEYATVNPTLAGLALLDDVDAAAQRTTLGLGSAATLNTGTSAGNVVVLDGSAKLPAVDGSLLTNLPSSGGVSTFNARTGAVTLTSGDVTGALGYTPPNGSFVAKDNGSSFPTGCQLSANLVAGLVGVQSVATGGTIAGSTLRYYLTSSGVTTPYALPGTWRNITANTVACFGGGDGQCEFQRIA